MHAFDHAIASSNKPSAYKQYPTLAYTSSPSVRIAAFGTLSKYRINSRCHRNAQRNIRAFTYTSPINSKKSASKKSITCLRFATSSDDNNPHCENPSTTRNRVSSDASTKSASSATSN